MIIELTKGNYEALVPCLLVVFMCDLAVIVSVAIDLYFGVRKSKKNGMYIHSFGLRRTFEKLSYYLALMLFLSIFDFLNPLWYLFGYKDIPILTMAGAIVFGVTEMISVREKSEDKVRNTSDAVAKEMLEKATMILEVVTGGKYDIEKLKELSNKNDKNE